MMRYFLLLLFALATPAQARLTPEERRMAEAVAKARAPSPCLSAW